VCARCQNFTRVRVDDDDDEADTSRPDARDEGGLKDEEDVVVVVVADGHVFAVALRRPPLHGGGEQARSLLKGTARTRRGDQSGGEKSVSRSRVNPHADQRRRRADNGLWMVSNVDFRPIASFQGRSRLLRSSASLAIPAASPSPRCSALPPTASAGISPPAGSFLP